MEAVKRKRGRPPGQRPKVRSEREERHEHIDNGPCRTCNGHAHTAECDIGYVRRHGANVRISELDIYDASTAGADA